jgi:hypothetical protein
MGCLTDPPTLQHVKSLDSQLAAAHDALDAKASDLLVLQRASGDAALRLQRELAALQSALDDARGAEDAARRRAGAAEEQLAALRAQHADVEGRALEREHSLTDQLRGALAQAERCQELAANEQAKREEVRQGSGLGVGRRMSNGVPLITEGTTGMLLRHTWQACSNRWPDALADTSQFFALLPGYAHACGDARAAERQFGGTRASAGGRRGAGRRRTPVGHPVRAAAGRGDDFRPRATEERCACGVARDAHCRAPAIARARSGRAASIFARQHGGGQEPGGGGGALP